MGFEAALKTRLKTPLLPGDFLQDRVKDGSQLGARAAAERLLAAQSLMISGFPTSHESLLAADLVRGKGVLARLSGYGFNGAYPASCPAIAGAAVLATQVRSCRFIYDPNQGATQQSGFVSMQLELARDGEVVSLLLGTHVVNVP